MKKALILTWDGYQDQEVIYPYYRLLEDEFIVDITSEKIGWFYGILGTKMEANKTVSSITDDTVNEYDFLCLPGGVKALEKLRQQKNALSFIKKFVDSGKVVSSTCHGAQLLISSKVTKGRKISAYYSIEDDVNNSGATYVDAPYVIDGNIVTSPHYKHMGAWMKASIELYSILKVDDVHDTHP
jgi:protease I